MGAQERPFSETTLRLLGEAGWHADRAVDTREYEEALKTEGYDVTTPVRDFLARFGGLRVVYPHPKEPRESNDLHFDVHTAISSVFPEWADYYAQRIGASVCLIGQAERGHLALLMAPDGNVYGGYAEFLVWIGGSGEEAIEALCTGGDLKEVPERQPR
jgi:hypothetical protein